MPKANSTKVWHRSWTCTSLANLQPQLQLSQQHPLPNAMVIISPNSILKGSLSEYTRHHNQLMPTSSKPKEPIQPVPISSIIFVRGASKGTTCHLRDVNLSIPFACSGRNPIPALCASRLITLHFRGARWPPPLPQLALIRRHNVFSERSDSTGSALTWAMTARNGTKWLNAQPVILVINFWQGNAGDEWWLVMSLRMGFTTLEGNSQLCDHFVGGKGKWSLYARFFLEEGIIYLIVKLFTCRQTEILSICT